jgi:hypothetical protein
VFRLFIKKAKNSKVDAISRKIIRYNTACTHLEALFLLFRAKQQVRLGMEVAAETISSLREKRNIRQPFEPPVNTLQNRVVYPLGRFAKCIGHKKAQEKVSGKTSAPIKPF